jgi:hypothetical protein
MNFSKLSWQDLYYDGVLDERCELFDEDCQEIIRIHNEDEWDLLSFKSEDEYWNSLDTDDDWELQLLRGQVSRKGVNKN